MTETYIEKAMRLLGLTGNQEWFNHKYYNDASFYHVVNVAMGILDNDKQILVSNKWLENLLDEIGQVDYCYVCRDHPSYGHSEGCPLGEK